MGHIKQAYWRQGLKFHISDATGSEIMRVKGPSNVSCLHPRIDKKTAVELYYVHLENLNEYVVGTFNVITQEKKTSGFVFGMQFPLDFTVEYKALVMSMGFLMVRIISYDSLLVCYRFNGAKILTWLLNFRILPSVKSSLQPVLIGMDR